MFYVRSTVSHSKYDEISSLIEERIRNSDYSAKLPPARTLAKEFEISTRTLTKALKPLFAKGLIVSDGPRGVLVNPGPNPRKKTGIVGVFVSGKNLPSEDNPLVAALKNAMAADNFKMLLMSTLDDELYRNSQFWSSNWLDGYIFLYSSFRKEFVADIKKKGIPFIAANWVPPEYGVNCVEFDNLGAFRKAVDFLYNKGRRRIALYFSHIKLRHLRDRIGRGFLDILESYGISNPDYFHCPDSPVDNSPEKAAEYFLSLKERPDAIIVYHQSAASIFENVFAGAGLHCPGDVQLVELGLDSYIPGKYPYLHAEYARLAGAAWPLFLDVMRNPLADSACKWIDIDFINNSK